MATLWMSWFAWAMLSGSTILGVAIGFRNDALERFWWVMFPPLWPLLLVVRHFKAREAEVARQAEVQRRRHLERLRQAREAELKSQEASAADKRLRAAMAAVNRLGEQARDEMYAAAFDTETTSKSSDVAKTTTRSQKSR